MDKQATPKNSTAIKRQQIRNVLIATGIVTGLGLGALLLTSNESPPAKTKPMVIATGATHVDDAAIWVQRAENMLIQERTETEHLKQKLTALDKEKIAQLETAKTYDDKYLELQQKINQLENQVNMQKQLAVPPVGIASDGSVLPVLPGQKPSSVPPSFTIKNDELSLTPASNATVSNDKNTQTYVPAGSFAKAVLISGLDSSAGVTSQTQPRPVTLRIVNQGSLPNHQHSHLKDCTATGAGYGDISSERVYIRLERLSCVAKDKTITDIPVYGYVTGPDGKAGIRGIPVWREGALLQRSFVSGLFSGLGNGIANGYTNTHISPIGGATQTVDASSIFKFGMASGASSALGKLAEYNIRRAEQYQPIIQMSGGIDEVDVVFHTGFYLDGRKDNKPQPVPRQTTALAEGNP